MTVTTIDFESGTNGADIVAGGTITAVSPSEPTYATAAAFTASDLGMASAGVQWIELAIPATDWSGSVYFRPLNNLGSSSFRPVSFRTTAPAFGGGIRFHSAGTIGIVNASNVLIDASSAVTWTPGDEFRLDWQFDDTGADVSLTLRIYKNANISGTTPDDTITRTIPGVDIGSVRIGSIDASWNSQYDNLSLSDVLEWIGPYIPAVTPLDTPVVTVVAENNPTTAGGTDGSIEVSWPAVTDADHYVAEIATGHDQTSGFSLDDANATSPHTFTGLAAGNYTVSIVAEPA